MMNIIYKSKKEWWVWRCPQLREGIFRRKAIHLVIHNLPSWIWEFYQRQLEYIPGWVLNFLDKKWKRSRKILQNLKPTCINKLYYGSKRKSTPFPGHPNHQRGYQCNNWLILYKYRYSTISEFYIISCFLYKT